MTTDKASQQNAEMKPEELRGDPSLSMIGLLIVVIILGYEWFVSGLTKIVNGDFVSGLAEELANKAADAPGWYTSFLNSTVIPNASPFGYLIEFGEVLIGLTFIVGSLLWLFAWKRLPLKVQTTVLFLTVAAAIGGIFMALNIHFANGLIHPWLSPADSFDEGVDFDSFLAVMNLVIAAVYIALLGRLRGWASAKVAAASQVRQSLNS